MVVSLGKEIMILSVTIRKATAKGSEEEVGYCRTNMGFQLRLSTESVRQHRSTVSVSLRYSGQYRWSHLKAYKASQGHFCDRWQDQNSMWYSGTMTQETKTTEIFFASPDPCFPFLPKVPVPWYRGLLNKKSNMRLE